MCTVPPSTQPANFNEYTEFMLKVLQNRCSQIAQLKSAAKMLAAIINRNDNIDDRVWQALNDFNTTRGHTEEVLAVNIWITKVIVFYYLIFSRAITIQLTICLNSNQSLYEPAR